MILLKRRRIKTADDEEYEKGEKEQNIKENRTSMNFDSPWKKLLFKIANRAPENIFKKKQQDKPIHFQSKKYEINPIIKFAFFFYVLIYINFFNSWLQSELNPSLYKIY